MEMLTSALRPCGVLLLFTMLFHVGIHQHSYLRRIYATLYTVAALFCFLSPHDFPPEFTTFFLGWVVHTSGILFVGETSPQQISFFSLDGLKTTFHLCTDFRGISSRHVVSDPDKSSFRPRFFFAMHRTLRTLLILAFNYVMTELVIKSTLTSLVIRRDDFSPANQGLVPSFQRKDLILRLIISTLWIWKTYVNLTVSHNILAISFVSVLRWNDESQWPVLFGSIADADSISRFWGAFWHRLHVLPFLRFQPSIRCLESCAPWTGKNLMVKNGLRAFWIFLCSAGCHAAVNHVVYGEAYLKAELRFSLCNWFVCLIEAMLKRTRKVREEHLGVSSHAQNRAIGLLKWTAGYIFVLGVFFCTVPGWRYQLIFKST